MSRLSVLLACPLLGLLASLCTAADLASVWTPEQVCPRPPAGSIVLDPPQTRSVDGVLGTRFVVRNAGLGPGMPYHNDDYRFCFRENDNSQRQSPVLRLNPGDILQLELANQLSPEGGFPVPHLHDTQPCPEGQNLAGSSIATLNLHFHGLNVAPVCGSDEVLRTVLQPPDPSAGNRSDFSYRFQIPANEPPGLFWYHPHIHGITQQQILGGMTGVMIIEGMEKFFPEVGQIRERILVVRDIDKSDPADDPEASDQEPWKDLSVNWVPVQYRSEATPILTMSPGERQFWRVANAAGDSHLVLQFQFRESGSTERWVNQPLELLAFDGVPFSRDNGKPTRKSLHVQQIVLPPASRAEFIVAGPPIGTSARLFSADYNAFLSQRNAHCAPDFPKSACDNTDRNPERTLARVVTTAPFSATAGAAAAPASPSPPDTSAGQLQRFAGLAAAKARRHRTLYFSKDPGENGQYFITVAGRIPKPFDMAAPPDITVQGPAVEDWTIQNRDNESHVFHIHQIHFHVLDVNGRPTQPAREHVLRDTIEIGSCRRWKEGIDPKNDPYGLGFPDNDPRHDPGFTGKNCLRPGRVTLRMDFRDRNIVGTFLYHCHILEHEDNGMMAKIELK